MAKVFSKSMSIQVLLSVPLILFGVVAIYLVNRSQSESAQVTSHDSSDVWEAMESEQAGNMSYTSPRKDSQAGMPVPPEGELHKTQELRHETGDMRHESLKSQVSGLKSGVLGFESIVEQLEELKYDGYMQVGDVRIAWLSDGKDRIAVAEGSAFDDTIRIDKIHENFLLVSLINQATTSAVDGRIVREIPFTHSPDDSGMGGQFGTRKRGESSHRSSLLPPSPDHSRPGLPSSSGKELPGQSASDVTQRSGSQVGDYGTVIHIDPASRPVRAVDETFTIRVKIDNGSNVFAVPFDISYNPDILEATGLHEGSYLKKDGGQSTFLTSTDRNKGKITVGLTRLGRIGGVSGSGTLMSIDFRALKRGTTLLSFANGKPMDPTLNALPVKFVSAEIKVE